MEEENVKSCSCVCKKILPNIQVAGTLIPQDKESKGRNIAHEENVTFIFEESRTLHFNQLVGDEKDEYEL
ncbi:hypothetical protein [Fictibacillus barbaricus]|uniref:Uncharacterized protein n=1 Tax=Fictibacillus barbaricus TaxID=182136 RepID=A0ABU1U099_9BACL|nr:hypothetical protein [Fictibacillus barbaricus]MDR7072889.1 hypothetical protein [Fictibacillus barbaricus]